MTDTSRLNLGWLAADAVAALLLTIGALGSYVATRTGGQRPAGIGAQAAMPAGVPTRVGDTSVPEVVVTLSEDVMRRARITVAAVGSGPATGGLRLPATVEPNAYKQVDVTSLVAGRVTRVLAELGAQMRQGQSMATVFSLELAEAQTQYISARAELEAHERELARTETLVQIGAASRQELDRIHAEHTSQRAGVESARSRLELLGLSRAVVDGLGSGTPAAPNIDVPAPISGVVTERLANVGMNVDPAAKLFTVVDLSTVWIVASLYEKDFSLVRVGDRVTVVTAAYPGSPLQGRVSYVDPQVSSETRTAKVRVEGSDRTAVLLVPRSAVQNIADRTVVYVPKPNAPGQFTERDVRLGQASGDRIEVVSGLVPGNQVVVEGSFLLRAERGRTAP